MKDSFKNKFLISTAILAGITLIGATNTAHAADNPQATNATGQSTANQLKAKLASDQQTVNDYQQKVSQDQQNVASDEAALRNAQTAQEHGQSICQLLSKGNKQLKVHMINNLLMFKLSKLL